MLGVEMLDCSVKVSKCKDQYCNEIARIFKLYRSAVIGNVDI